MASGCRTDHMKSETALSFGSPPNPRSRVSTRMTFPSTIGATLLYAIDVIAPTEINVRAKTNAETRTSCVTTNT